MTKYKVPQAVMDDLDTLKDRSDLSSIYGTLSDIKYSKALQEWVYDSENTLKREQAVIDYAIHRKDNFEVKAPTWAIVSKKADRYIVRSDSADGEGGYWYVFIREDTGGSPSWPANALAELTYIRGYATEFDTYAEAKEWANSHQVVVELDEYGNEI